MMMGAQTVFDIGSKAFDWVALVPALGLFLFGVSLTWMEKKKIGKFVIKKIGYILCLGGAVFAAYGFTSWELRAHNGVRALQTKQYSIVEGPIHDFHAMPVEGHKEESFSVQNEGFSYSDYIVTPCFNSTASHGGPLHDGLNVRIYYLDNCILRVELIARRSTPDSRTSPIS